MKKTLQARDWKLNSEILIRNYRDSIERLLIVDFQNHRNYMIDRQPVLLVRYFHSAGSKPPVEPHFLKAPVFQKAMHFLIEKEILVPRRKIP